ncbi:hypothetical protein BYT27DRAFT_7264855 [Phlegmacium glaucopus]|nr:hypothetical protein BYT27DRAFT_7264855 [Phlegmacium glaucopus]
MSETNTLACINTVTQMFVDIVHAFRQLGVRAHLDPEPGLSPMDNECVTEIIVTALAQVEMGGVNLDGSLNLTEPALDGVDDSGSAQVLNAKDVDVDFAERIVLSLTNATVRDHPLLCWVPEIDNYVEEILRLEGRTDAALQTTCAEINCSSPAPTFCCMDCLNIQKWNGSHFVRVPLKDLGVCIQLGHADKIYPLPERTFNDDFTIVAANGIHQVTLSYYGSTVTEPKTAAMFDVLETFQLLRMDNTGTSPPPDCYLAFLCIMREWRHVRLLKMFGQGHDPTGVKGTQEEGSAKALKHMNVSSDGRDPGLNHGYAYIVEEKKFKEYLLEYNNKVPDDKSTCNNHDAIKSASMHGSKGTAASGLGTTECSHHDMKQPNAVGDLQKGERYVNMD